MSNDQFTEAMQEAYASVGADTILPTLEVRVPQAGGGTAALRMVRDHGTLLEGGDPDIFGHVLRLEETAPVDAGEDVTFVATMFDFELPEQKDGPIPSITISIDNVARFLAPHIDAAVAARQKIQVTYREYLASDTTTPQYVLKGMALNAVKSTQARVEASAEFVNLVNINFPGRVYEPDEFPGLEG